MEVKFLRAAKSRLIEIWGYTERTWGEEQADKYIRGLVGSIQEAASFRNRWRPVMDAELPGVYFIQYERHFIFFRALPPDAIGVISVLHENMNIPMRLREDATRQRDD
ncbi:MAG: type II toxin-antitoxin system RelE/ParE family toxin [Planctomyces sp.]|nr:type II toxin-antitoxin system RelE/ParE family toxin [Planctomyces sp.]